MMTKRCEKMMKLIEKIRFNPICSGNSFWQRTTEIHVFLGDATFTTKTTIWAFPIVSTTTRAREKPSENRERGF